MLDHLPDRKLADRAREFAVVHAHPTLPPVFYSMVPSSYSIDPELINIGYFGVFYTTRGLTEVVDALAQIAGAVHRRVRLHVFTQKPEALAEHCAERGLSDVILPRPYVDFLEYLNLTTRFDALLVNDAKTLDTHDRNPYLPSKLSDYRGSGRPIWAIVEPGSQLSRQPVQYRSELGDVAGAADVIAQIVADTQKLRSIRGLAATISG
jgi:hypothetical protein